MNKAAAQLREKKSAEVHEELIALRRELFNLRMQQASQQNQKNSEFRRVRRAVARAITVLGEK